jgi:hypothetical protein
MTNNASASPVWLLRTSLPLANRKVADFDEKADKSD